MTGVLCGYCFRPAVVRVLVTSWFGWRKQWRPVCRKHVKRAAGR